MSPNTAPDVRPPGRACSTRHPPASANSRRRSRAAGTAGFSLVEVLVALAVTAVVIAAVAQLAGVNARGARTLAVHAALMETARAVETGIPPRRALALGRTDGEIAGQRWRMDVRQMAGGTPQGPGWEARSVLIRVRAPTGELVSLETIRIVKADP